MISAETLEMVEGDHAARLAAVKARYETRIAEMEGLLRRLLQWDHLDGSADGPYWRSEIERTLVKP